MDKVKKILICIYEETLYKWLSIYWYQYLFDKADNPLWISDNKFIDWFERLKCRIKRHPCGSIYYNPGGYEPDYRCSNCGDELG
uniref:Uncharacterized protein n=1 Tax=viral metagenome TaxID=1070528 RepID=A0A6M3L277_9ZZZZ